MYRISFVHFLMQLDLLLVSQLTGKLPMNGFLSRNESVHRYICICV